MPPARLAVIFSIRLSPPEQARPGSSAPMTAGQSMTASAGPLPAGAVDGDEPGELGPVQPVLGDEQLGSGLETVQAPGVGAQAGGERVGGSHCCFLP